jgi:hypothetical protein
MKKVMMRVVCSVVVVCMMVGVAQAQPSLFEWKIACADEPVGFVEVVGRWRGGAELAACIYGCGLYGAAVRRAKLYTDGVCKSLVEEDKYCGRR